MHRSICRDVPKPTQAELAILSILWQQGPSTVREVHEIMNTTEQTGYTTALKLLQVMHGKGLVERDDSQRAHVYRPTRTRNYMQSQFVTDLVQRMFDGSPSQLVLHALGNTERTSSEDLAKIRQLIEQLEQSRE